MRPYPSAPGSPPPPPPTVSSGTNVRNKASIQHSTVNARLSARLGESCRDSRCACAKGTAAPQWCLYLSRGHVMTASEQTLALLERWRFVESFGSRSLRYTYVHSCSSSEFRKSLSVKNASLAKPGRCTSAYGQQPELKLPEQLQAGELVYVCSEQRLPTIMSLTSVPEPMSLVNLTGIPSPQACSQPAAQPATRPAVPSAEATI